MTALSSRAAVGLKRFTRVLEAGLSHLSGPRSHRCYGQLFSVRAIAETVPVAPAPRSSRFLTAADSVRSLHVRSATWDGRWRAPSARHASPRLCRSHSGRSHSGISGRTRRQNTLFARATKMLACASVESDDFSCILAAMPRATISVNVSAPRFSR